MKIFDSSLLRLKQIAEVTTDQEVAELLGMSKAALSDRKRRDSFPEDKVRALAQQRPELGIDVDYVITGTTEAESLRQRDALHAAAGVSPVVRSARLAEGELVQNFRACPPDVQEALLVLSARLASPSGPGGETLTPDGRYPKAGDGVSSAVHEKRRKSL
jgi:transcriptional regulator with XRE-family HTH domain